MKIQIRARFATLAEAVTEANLDLSYNPREAKSKIENLDRSGSIKGAFLTEDGRVLYLYQCDILLLNEFDPFISVLDEVPFVPAVINGKDIFLHTEIRFPRDCRKLIKDMQSLQAEVDKVPVTTLRH